MVEPGEPALAALVERFGPGILDGDGRLDRPALAAIAFADDDGRKALGDITWPAIGEEFERRIKEAPDDAVVVCDVPLLVESKAAATRPYVAVIVVEAPVEPAPGPARDPGRGPRRRRAADGGPGDRRRAAGGGHARRRQRRRPGVTGPPGRRGLGDSTTLREPRSPTGITVTPRR